MLVPSSGNFSRLDDEAESASPGRGQRTVASGGASVDLRNLWLILRWRARLIALITLATVALLIGALVILPPKYKATTIVLVDPRQPHVTKTEAVLSGIGADVAAVESQVELIASSALASKVIASLKLADDPELASPSPLEHLIDGVLTLFGRDPDAFEKTRANRIIDKFQRNLTVRRRGLTYVLEISYVANEPAKAAGIANAVAEAYLDDQRSAKGRDHGPRIRLARRAHRGDARARSPLGGSGRSLSLGPQPRRRHAGQQAHQSPDRGSHAADRPRAVPDRGRARAIGAGGAGGTTQR